MTPISINLFIVLLEIVFLNPHDKQIPKLSLIFEFDEEVAEIIDTVKNESKLYLFNFIDTTLQTP